MNSSRRTFLLAVLLSVVFGLFAATSFDVPENELAKSKPEVTFDVDLQELTFSEVGFSSTHVNDINGEPTTISLISLDNRILDESNKPTDMFESDEFHVYWKFIGSNSQFPNIRLKQSNKLDNYNLPDSTSVDWVVSICKDEASDVFEDILDTSVPSSGVIINGNEKVIADGVTPVDVLDWEVHCYKLKLRTKDAFWLHPDAIYTSELWLTVEPK